MKKIAPKVCEILTGGQLPIEVLFCCGYNFDELKAELKRKKLKYHLKGIQQERELFKESPFFAFTLEIESKGECFNIYYIVMQPAFTFSDNDYITLAHECLHICQWFLPTVMDRSVEIENEGYFHSYLMQQALHYLRLKPKKTTNDNQRANTNLS